MPIFEVQAAPTFEERAEWMRILNETACHVSKLFRRTADRSAHVHEVDQQTGGAALKEAELLGREVMRAADAVTRETQRL